MFHCSTLERQDLFTLCLKCYKRRFAGGWLEECEFDLGLDEPLESRYLDDRTFSFG